MSSTIISPKAEVSPKARIGEGCKIFPFVYIEDDVVIGDNCIIFPFVSILNGTRMGNGNKIHQGFRHRCLAAGFQFQGRQLAGRHGRHEHHPRERSHQPWHTRGRQDGLGPNNVLMEGVHISHDTRVSNSCVIGYGTKIAGDCEIEDGVIFSSSVIENA